MRRTPENIIKAANYAERICRSLLEDEDYSGPVYAHVMKLLNYPASENPNVLKPVAKDKVYAVCGDAIDKLAEEAVDKGGLPEGEALLNAMQHKCAHIIASGKFAVVQ